MTQCYVVMSGTAGFSSARAACQAFGGASDLVSYTTGESGGQAPAAAWARPTLSQQLQPTLHAGNGRP
jgi:hypothetical protein